MSTITLSSRIVEPSTLKSAISASSREVHEADDPSSEQRQLITADYLHYDALYSVKGMPSHPVVMARGEGAFLWDLEGKRYIDFNAGFSACNQGHCHPKIVAAMMRQCQQLTMPSRSVHVSQYAMFCRKICELTGFDKVAAMNGGAEAVDMAIKIARAWGYRCKGIEADKAIVLTASNNYHGRTLSILSASTDESYRKNCGPWMPGVGAFCAGEEVRFGVIEDLERAFQKCGHQIAAYLIEPVQGHAGCLPATDEYLIRVRELCMKPDMVVIGKSLSGGLYPISAVLGTNEAMTSVDPGQYGSTFSGNPLASAVAIAALDVIIDESLPARAKTLGDKFETRLRAIKSPYFDTVTGKVINEDVMLEGVDILEKALNDLPAMEEI
ncbi:Ornithine aminotransferase [Pleurostoma richardsiae]|uniref:Ornithine aminotransferase n=1 Tax=Pleurostoma richardsiae TaxID=41990 RepID=A0AA38VEG2_9PEZI|nr:Ornithine aminotransferase [Pleurostoma richardsiae]